VTLSFKAKAY